MSDTKTADDLRAALRGFLPTIDTLDAADPAAAMAKLTESFPFDGEAVGAVRAICDAGLEAGWLAPRNAGPDVKYGRLDKDLGGYAIDIVLMKDGSGMGHTHTKGEFNMCFAMEGEPRFDGHPPGWVVFGLESHHVPTVTGGTMLFVYFTPDGAVVWDK